MNLKKKSKFKKKSKAKQIAIKRMMVKIVRIQTGGHSCFLEGLVRISWPKERK
jgi:hypothetical protein